jgi:hypothetical protein
MALTLLCLTIGIAQSTLNNLLSGAYSILCGGQSFDKNIIVLAKRFGANQSVIARYELPKERVLVSSN